MGWFFARIAFRRGHPVPTSEFVFPHHALHGERAAATVFGGGFFVVGDFYFAIDHEVDELADGHACVDAYGLGN